MPMPNASYTHHFSQTDDSQFLTATTPNALFTHDDPKTISTDTLLAMPDIDK